MQKSNSEQEHISTRYTLVPIKQPEHQRKLQAYMAQPTQPKTSYCRFYLRGICIMKPNHCKFAHSFEQLVLQQDQEELLRNCNYTEKQRKKVYFESKRDFQQKALFILKDVDYLILHEFQFSEKWNTSKHNKKILSLAQIKHDRDIRTKLRQTLHRQHWLKLINFLIQKYPNVDFSISFLSKWFSKVGFEKPQTRCKFGDFMRYLIFICEFKEINIIMPPRVQKTVFFVNCRPNCPKTYLYANIKQIQEIHLKAKQEYKQEMIIKLQPLPEQCKKKFMCRYYMAGNCEYSQEQCKYAHSIKALKYQVGQKFELFHKQSVKGREQRLNYVSLFNYCKDKIDPNITQEQLNGNSNLRIDPRRKMHVQLYSNFMDQLIRQTGLQRFQLSFIERQYKGAGFNHSQQNKFGQFQSSLWQNGYLVQDIKFPDQKNKLTYAYKIPSNQYLDKYFSEQINEILSEEVNKLRVQQQKQKQLKTLAQQAQNKIKSNSEKQINEELQQLKINQMQQPRQLILQSSFRKKLYRIQQPFTIPLHVYLRLKNKSLQLVIKQLVKDEYLLSHIFFQTNQQNYKKLIEICKTFFKGKKDYIHKLENIELYIKNLHKQQINLNGFVNFRNLLQSAILDSGKRLYFLAFGNNNIVIDKGNLCLHEKTFVKNQYQLKNYESHIEQIQQKIKSSKYNKQRIIVVDNQQTQQYSQLFLINCNKLGVDLQGKLKKQGYIDLIQISGIFNNQKQIFVFDIFLVNKMENKMLYQKIKSFLKILFQDQNRVKILHDCKQDSAALNYLMGIKLKHVFDTSGMNIILQQKQIYQSWNKKQQTNHHLLKKVYDVRTPGLNSVLQRWGAPNGVNIFKHSMKKLFQSEGTRQYFEKRPIDPQFLEYSAQDVEDLIDIYENMKKQDTQKLSEVIGQLYSTFNQT